MADKGKLDPVYWLFNGLIDTLRPVDPKQSCVHPAGQSPVPTTGNTLPEKLYGAVGDVVGQEKPKESIPETTKSFMEEVSEFTGRIYGQAREAVRFTGAKTQEETVGVKDAVTKGWTGDKAKEEESNNEESKTKGAIE